MNLSALDITYLAIAAVLFGLTGLFINKKLRDKRHSYQSQQFDYVPGSEPSFQDRLVRHKLRPERVLVYGQSFLAHDKRKKKLLFQSRKHPDGVLLRENELLSFALVQDGETIVRASRTDTGGTLCSIPPSLGCSELTLYISTSNRNAPEIRLPLITFTMDTADACAPAYTAAGEFMDALHGLLGR